MYLNRFGGYAELVSAEYSSLAPKPRNASWAEAAGLPLAGLTALQAVEHLAPATGDTLLVHGAAGAVGSLAVQLAVAAGARVLGTASPAKHADIRSFGVDHPIDYRGSDFAKEVRRITGERKPIEMTRGELLRVRYTISWPSSTLRLAVSPVCIDSRCMKGCTSRGRGVALV